MRLVWIVGATLLLGSAASAQVQYARGQNVAPVFEGWEHNPDGTFNMVFGYLNRNYEEELDIPIGPANNLSGGSETSSDRGQPTHFYPRRQRFLFRVVVPKDWDKQQKIIWTLTSYGRTDQAKGWLQPEWELSSDVMIENMGGGVPDPGNKPPSLTVTDLPPIASNHATLTATASDDGLPKPYRRAPSNPDRDSQPKRPRGVQIKWIQYRGPGKVTFDPAASEVVYGQPVTLTSKASFGAPGLYVLRATANDGQLFTSRDITVNVGASAGAVNGTLTAGTCSTMADLRLPDTDVTAARVVAAGEFVSPNPALKKLPAFCRVQGVIHPASDSHIEFEVWLPISGWNGKYLGVGNGGFAGSINYASGAASNAPGMAEALAAGYATSSTDTGHEAATTNADWAVGHPEKVIDYGYRAVHLTAVNAKQIVAAFYSKSPISYFSSCSNGGRQALMEAQRYPSDYTGIVAGDPAWYSTHLAAAQIWNVQAIMASSDSYIPAGKLPAIEAAVLDKCDALDGVRDSVIDDPRKCRFDPAVLRCKGAESDSCLTGPQVEALRKIYAGPANSTGEQIFPGLLPGGETGAGGWGQWILGSQPGNSLIYAFGVGGLAKIVYQDPAWDFRRFNFDRDVRMLDDKLGPVRNATETNLKPFQDAGGKLILYHGLSDPDISPQSTMSYYDQVVAKMGEKNAGEFMRVYMVPGMQHCGSGPGATILGSAPGAGADPQHGIQASLERWVEKSSAPGEIIATKYIPAGREEDAVVRTRPICPYPKIARYKGSGSTDQAANYSCVNEPGN